MKKKELAGSKGKLPVHRQLLEAIFNGMFQPFTPLPPIRELAKIFNVSKGTLQTAINEMNKEGVVVTIPRRGVIVQTPIVRVASKRIAFVTQMSFSEGNTDDPYISEVVTSFKNAVEDAGFEFVFVRVHRENQLNIKNEISEQNFGGIVIFEISNTLLTMELRSLRLPIVSIDHDTRSFGIPSVRFDNEWFSIQMVNYLFELGHKKITMVDVAFSQSTGSNAFFNQAFASRKNGYRLAMKNAGLPYNFIEYKRHDEDLIRIFENLMNSSEAPTGIICGSTPAVQGACDTLRTIGKAIPQCVSVIGVGDNNTKFAKGKNMAVLRPNWKQMGKEAGRIINQLLSEEVNVKPLDVIIGGKIYPNQSVYSCCESE